MSRPRPRVGALLALAVVATLLPVGPSSVRAGEGLVTLMDATYDVLPEEARVHVAIDAVSTSLEEDAPEGPVYYAGISLNIPPGSSNVSASSGSTPLEITVTPIADAIRVDVGFSEQVFLDDSYHYQVVFDLVDEGGAADRDFRIGHSIVAFPVWAFGTPGEDGNSVAVRLPAAFEPSVYGGPLEQTTDADGALRLSADVVNPQDWFAYVTAERPGIFTEVPFNLAVGDRDASLIVRAWDDDPDWGNRIRSLLTDGLPALHELVGLDWPVAGDLKVEESANRLGDYAGIYNRVTEQINVRYDADATVTLHEAAHVWFNDDLFADRWIGEAWAEFYAVHSAQAIGVTGETFTLTDDLLAAQIPLNDWGEIGAESQDVEAYAYAASYHLAELISERTDFAGLRAVWRAAASDEMAYQPIHATGDPQTEQATNQAGWQVLLDLLEERTGADYDDLWVTWVADDREADLLATRAATRERYLATVSEAGAWELPEAVRADLGAWQFDDVADSLDTADRVLGLAAELDELADELELEPPNQLRVAFEGSDGLDAALTEVNKELFALEQINDATDGLAADPDPVEWLGLLFSEPEVELDAARTTWEAGDHGSAGEHAEAVLTILDEADDHGRERLGIGGVVLLLGAGVVAVVWRRRNAPDDPEATIPPPDEAVEEAA
ncbi:MAG TPA: hypothetical protein VIC63_04895 [Candidatus Limnocylindria bacterium]